MNFDDVNNRIITIRNQNVILDSDVAKIYGVQTMRINEAVKNNPKKFPKGYILEVQSAERQELIENFDRLESLKHSISTKAFTEKGLYMLATILKSERAIDATIQIVEAFAKIKELSRNIVAIQETTDEIVHQSLLQKSGKIINDVLFSNIPIDSSETSVELNLGLMKAKHTVRSKNSDYESDLREIKRMLKKISNK